MINLTSLREAEENRLPPSQVQCISPFVNPAHVLAPPRAWLEALVSGKYGWEFFRFRYKCLLRQRYKADPARFENLLNTSEGVRVLTLTCHCLTDQCHRTPARDFLESVRARRLPAATRNGAGTVRIPPAREWAHKPHPGLILATLIEHPRAVPGVPVSP
jgi:hypothetical protein